jgi:hypothetical protein
VGGDEVEGLWEGGAAERSSSSSAAAALAVAEATSRQ